MTEFSLTGRPLGEPTPRDIEDVLRLGGILLRTPPQMHCVGRGRSELDRYHPPTGELLSAGDVARALGISIRWLARNWPRLPFAVPGTDYHADGPGWTYVHFNPEGMDLWLREHRGRMIPTNRFSPRGRRAGRHVHG